MRNRLTFANVIGVLLDNKKKTYPQHQLVRSLFSAYLDDTLEGSDLWAMGIARGLISFPHPTFSSTPMGKSCGI